MDLFSKLEPISNFENYTSKHSKSLGPGPTLADAIQCRSFLTIIDDVTFFLKSSNSEMRKNFANIPFVPFFFQ